MPAEAQIKTASDTDTQFLYEYGVFLSAEPEDMDRFKEYKVVVIDGQEFSAEDIRKMKSRGQIVYSYINIGSIETFRSYFSDFAHLTLAPYENWDDEYWIDVSSGEWQKFIIDRLAAELNSKGIDGYFVDNADVYYQYQNREIYKGLCNIVKALKSTGNKVIINGGDTFVSALIDSETSLSDYITGINQETVITSIDFENNYFGLNDREERSYFEKYISKVKKAGSKVYLLEYASDPSIIYEIDKFAKENNYIWYAADSIELKPGGGKGMLCGSNAGNNEKPAIKIRRAAISSIRTGKGTITVNMTLKPAALNGRYFRIAYKQKGKSRWNYITTSSKSKTIKKLRKGRRYYIKVRAFKYVKGRKYTGLWSSIRLSKKVK